MRQRPRLPRCWRQRWAACIRWRPRTARRWCPWSAPARPSRPMAVRPRAPRSWRAASRSRSDHCHRPNVPACVSSGTAACAVLWMLLPCSAPERVVLFIGGCEHGGESQVRVSCKLKLHQCIIRGVNILRMFYTTTSKHTCAYALVAGAHAFSPWLTQPGTRCLNICRTKFSYRLQSVQPFGTAACKLGACRQLSGLRTACPG